MFFVAIALTFFSGCTMETEQDVPVDGIHSFSIHTKAPSLESDDVNTKASMKATVKLQWSDGDQISVINLSTGKTMIGNLTAKVDGDKVSFEGDLSGAIKAGNKMAAIYPCQNYNSITTASDINLDLSTQTCSTKDDLQFAAYSIFECKTTGVVDVTSDFQIPLSFNQITLATIEPETDINYIEITNVGNGISFHVNSSEGSLEPIPSVGTVRINPESKLSGKNGALFAYCALASSPASIRTISVMALPKLYCTSWAESAMSTSKFYTSIASDFKSQEYKDFMVSASSSLEVGSSGGYVVFSVTSNKVAWNASVTPSLEISSSSGNSCENLEIVVTVPQNDESSDRSFHVAFSGGTEEYDFIIKQEADPSKKIVEFADINLKKYMVTLFDEDGDGQISTSEAENVESINCSERNISDLSGLEQCPNLKYLNFNGNYVSEIVLPNMKKLETIVAYDNPVEKIVVNNDTALTSLYLQGVNTNAIISATTIKINAYTQASTLYIAFAGTKYNLLQIINCSNLTSFDVSENVQLKALFAYNNPLITKAMLSSLPKLKTLHIYGCALEELNVDNNPNLENLLCNDNKLTSLNVDNNLQLKVINVANNQLTNIKISNNTLLETVNIKNNKFQTLIVRKNALLKDLNISDNVDITAISLSNNTALESLDASNTGLSDIDLSTNLEMKKLNASKTNITNLNLEINTKIEDLNLAGCLSLSSLTVAKNTNIKSLSIANTPFKKQVPVGYNLSIGVVFFVSGSGVVGIISTDQAYLEWGYYGTITSAQSWYNGRENTDIIKSSSPAAQWCLDKGSDWYLPAAEQMRKYVYPNLSVINETLSQIGGVTIDGEYWTSTDHSTQQYDAWNIDFPSGVTNHDRAKNKKLYVRAARFL